MPFLYSSSLGGSIPFHSIPFPSRRCPFHSISSIPFDPFHSIPFHSTICSCFSSVLPFFHSIPFHPSIPFHLIQTPCLSRLPSICSIPFHSIQTLFPLIPIHPCIFHAIGSCSSERQLNRFALGWSVNLGVAAVKEFQFIHSPKASDLQMSVPPATHRKERKHAQRKSNNDVSPRRAPAGGGGRCFVLSCGFSLCFRVEQGFSHRRRRRRFAALRAFPEGGAASRDERRQREIAGERKLSEKQSTTTKRQETERTTDDSDKKNKPSTKRRLQTTAIVGRDRFVLVVFCVCLCVFCFVFCCSVFEIGGFPLRPSA